MIKVDEALRARNPEKPWLWRRDWTEKRIHHSHRKDGAALMLFAIAWNAICLPIAYIVLTGEHPIFIKIILGIFTLLGALLLFGGVRMLIIGMRYPQSTLLLNNVPQKLGSKFSARIQAPALPDGDVWTFASCVLSRTQKYRDTLTKIERDVPRTAVNRTPEGWVIPVEIDLPATAEETRNLGKPGEVAWELSFAVGKDKAAPTISGRFPIPVFGGKKEPEDDFEAALARLPEDVRKKIEADIR